MTINILVNGASGRMGQLSVQTISKDTRFKLVGQTGRKDDLAQEIKKTKAQVILDFTNAEAVFKNAEIIIAAGARPVIGTSGLMKDQVQLLQDQAKKQKVGGIIASSFCLGAILMMKYAQEIVKYFPQVEIIEMHHDGKLDSPSGTAMRSAELIALSRSQSPKIVEKTRETIPGARGAQYQQIPIHSVRLPGLVAHQQIIFGGLGETLTIRHDSIDRQSFMPGVLLACSKAMELDQLIYGLENVM